MSSKKVIVLDSSRIEELFKKLSEREVEIKGATLKDALCSYKYELLKGPTKGDKLNHNGAHIIHEDLHEAFDGLSVFIAHLDDAYTGNDNSTVLKDLIAEPETEKYHVNSFDITGVEENRAVILTGWKEVNHGVVTFKTPKVKLNGTYLYLIALKEAIYKAVEEVENYRNGKTAPEADPDQINMEFKDEDDNAFANAAVNVEEEVEE